MIIDSTYRYLSYQHTLENVQFIYLLSVSRKVFYSQEIHTISLEKGFALDLGWRTMFLLALLVWYINSYEKSVYLVNFTTFEPPESWKLSPEQLIQIMRAQNCFTEDSIQFLDRMLQQSGVGPSTAWPPG